MEATLIIVGVMVLIAFAISFYKWGQSYPEFFYRLLSFLECCSMMGVFGVTIVITGGAFLLWHSLLVAGLAGVGTITTLSFVLSIAAALYKPVGQS